uniref:LRRCT domain-containing protein n=1 Tax=Ditylenchus dipsaci TaxID=166011 RepID=A0A915E1X9_9BILA
MENLGNEGSTPKSFPSIKILPVNAVSKLLHNRRLKNGLPVSEISLLFTGDTQYHFPCTSTNYESKSTSSGQSSEKDETVATLNDTFSISPEEQEIDECLRIESKFSNEVQRKSIFDLNRNMETKPAALVINGDLTNFGHTEQLELFKTFSPKYLNHEWLTLPIPIYAGLGNHDYENNVNDCVSNQCAHNMLEWFTQEYSNRMNLTLDISTNSLLWKKTVEGSLAYSKNFCSGNDGLCIHLIQLHNRPDYAASISSMSEWKIRGSFNWLLQDLQSIGNHSWPVLINLHNHNHKVAKRLKATLEQWMSSTENQHIIRRVIVLFAHLHEQHTIIKKCLGGVTVPYIYVGSVPNNRYSMIKFWQPDQAGIFLLQANDNSTLKKKDEYKVLFACITVVLLLVVGKSSGQQWYEDEEQEEDAISQEVNPDVLTDDDEDKPDVICANGRMCSCIRGVDARDPNVVDCSHATLKNSGPLDTAYLMIQLEKDPKFKAQVVKLDNNNIHYLQRGLIMPGHESSILSLDFSFNQIGTVERNSFDAFDKLVKLKLTHNRLRYYEISDDWLTAKLGASLHQLYLDYNFIEKLDDGIFDNLKNLTKLVLDGNNGLKLTAQTFGSGLGKLRTLSLDNCGLEVLDDNIFKHLVNLTQLSLSGNKFTTIPSAVANIPKLSIVAMSENPLVKLTSSAFKANSQTKANNMLKTIYLRKMPMLTEVEACAFCGLTSLETVDLSGSKNLASLHVGAFGTGEKKNLGATKVKTLLLSDCALTSVSEDLLQWTDDHKLALSGNPLLCDCENMQWLMVNKAKIQFQKEKPTCAAPEKVKGMTLKEANTHGCGAIQSSSSQKMTLIVVLVGLCASIFIVGFFYARSKGGVRNFLPVGRPASPQLGYSNLNARANPMHNTDGVMDDEDRLEDDFNRPEFV